MEAMQLWLPSDIPLALRSDGTVQSLADQELRLRLAQADGSLSDIRRLRRIMAGITQFKRLNVDGTGQKAATRIRNYYSGFRSKVKFAVRRYRAAYRALNAPDPEGPQMEKFKYLRDEDICGPGKDPEDTTGLTKDRRGPREGYQSMSWIWRVPGSHDSAKPELRGICRRS